MRLRFTVVITVLAILLIFANTNVALAQWSAINSGYAVTTNYHGIDVPVGETVVAVAGTTESSDPPGAGDVFKIEFKWIDSDGNERTPSDVVEWSSFTNSPPADAPQEVKDWAKNNPDVTVWYARSERAPDVPGWWTVKALFQREGTTNGEAQDKFRATSLFYIDEVPLGTILVLLIPLGFLGIYAMKRKQSISTEAA